MTPSAIIRPHARTWSGPRASDPEPGDGNTASRNDVPQLLLQGVVPILAP